MNLWLRFSLARDKKRNVVSFNLYGIGYALFKIEMDATSKSSMLQGFSRGYIMNHDTSFMMYITNLYRVAWVL